MNNEILKILYHDYTDMDFSAEGIAPFDNEEWQEETAAINKFAERLSLSDRASLEIDVICGFMYKSGLEGFIIGYGFKLATRLFVGK